MPNPYAIIAVIIIWLCSLWYTYDKAESITSQARDAALLQQADANAKTLSDAVAAAEQSTRSLYENQIAQLKYSARHPLPDKCVLSPEFQMQFNATTGLPPDPTPRSVTPEEVISTTRDNNGACQQNAIWLNECNAVCSQ